jgi:hypothetical protein
VNLVTAVGEIFKADGEILTKTSVARPGQDDNAQLPLYMPGPYDLRTNQAAVANTQPASGAGPEVLGPSKAGKEKEADAVAKKHAVAKQREEEQLAKQGAKELQAHQKELRVVQAK